MTKSAPTPALASIHTLAFDFDGVFTDNKVSVDETGRESVRCDRADGLGFDLVRAFQRRGQFHADIFILSKETNPVVMARAAKLKLACHASCGDTLAFMQERLARLRPADPDPMAGVVYVGNDLNDLRLMSRVGFAVAPADAHPMVLRIAHLVMDQRGGEGFVRAVIERLLSVDRCSPETLDELLSGH